MTAPKVLEIVLAGSLFAVAPVAGDYYRSRTGLSVLAVARVRRMLGERSGVRYRLFVTRLRLCDLPALVMPLPWPCRVTQPLPLPVGAVTAEAAPGAPPPLPVIIPIATRRTAERKRVIGLLRDDRDEQRAVPSIRTANHSVSAADWIDPDDVNPRRREAKRISGYRGRDSIQALLDNGTISKAHARAARRFRRDYELGEIGLRACRNLAEAPSGYASGTGPSETRMAHLQAYQSTTKALMPHLLEAVLSILIRDETLLEYATRKSMNRQAVSGYLLAAADLLSDYYKKLDDERKKERESVGDRATA